MIEVTDRGLYCAGADIYIDPWAAVERAVITHAHADHAHPGCGAYLCSDPCAVLLRERLGAEARIQSVPYGPPVHFDGFEASFHPAGHVLGSAQVRIAHAGEVWVVSGDYKLHADPTCAPFELVPCHTFITESTYALPVYRWPQPEDVFVQINNWWAANQVIGRTSVLFAYSLWEVSAGAFGNRCDARSDLRPRRRREVLERLCGGRNCAPSGRAGRLAACAHRARSRTGDRTSLCGRLVVDAQVRRGVHRVRIWLDANSRRPPAASGRPGLCPLRPCRLERFVEGDRCNGRREHRRYTGPREALPDGTVLDGEILAWRDDDNPLPFATLQRRLGRKNVQAELWDPVTVVFMAYDLLEAGGQDWRWSPLWERRSRLEALAGSLDRAVPLRVSPVLTADAWQELARLQGQARSRSVEGLMLKRLSSPYGVGRPKGDWWKWKVDPYTVDTVLIYAQRGHGRRASLFTDYTFGVWSEGELVPVAKAYSGLTDEEIREVDSWVRRHTIERIGPVHAVQPVPCF